MSQRFTNAHEIDAIFSVPYPSTGKSTGSIIAGNTHSCTYVSNNFKTTAIFFLEKANGATATHAHKNEPMIITIKNNKKYGLYSNINLSYRNYALKAGGEKCMYATVTTRDEVVPY